MDLRIFSDKLKTGEAAATAGAKLIRRSIAERGFANVILATGASQLEMLAHLIDAPDINWHCVTAFHLDEYVGLSISHPASFRKYLWQRFVSRLAFPMRAFHYLDGDSSDVAMECTRVGKIIRRHPIDVAFVGIGENGHLAFNDPPADFETTQPYHVVDLDVTCRQQQLGEGWFSTFADVPTQAISMSVRQIMNSKAIICTVPDRRKADAVRNVVEGTVTSYAPASILQLHKDCTLFVDESAASELTRLAKSSQNEN
jgi:glucosamine-6-phosphate deaminase